MQNTPEHFGREYFSKIEKACAQDRIKMEFDDMLSLCSPSSGSKVLDAGCGTGEFGKLIQRRFDDVDVHFCDLSPEARQHVPAAVLCPLEETHYPSETFDRVYCLNVLSHLNDVVKGLAEMRRITRE